MSDFYDPYAKDIWPPLPSLEAPPPQVIRYTDGREFMDVSSRQANIAAILDKIGWRRVPALEGER